MTACGSRPHNGEKKEVAIVPDSVFSVIAYNMRFWFAVEAIAEQKSGRLGRNKIRAYNAWIDSGKFEKRYNDSRMRVVTRRSYSLFRGKASREPQKSHRRQWGAKRFWFTAFEAIDLMHPMSIFERDHLASGDRRTRRAIVETPAAERPLDLVAFKAISRLHAETAIPFCQSSETRVPTMWNRDMVQR